MTLPAASVYSAQGSKLSSIGESVYVFLEMA